MNRLGVKNAAGKVVTCANSSAACDYKHTEQLTSITKATALKCTAVRSIDPLLAASFLKAVEARAEDSWSLRERAPKKPKGRGERDRGPEAPMQRFTVKVSDSAPQVMELDSSPALIHGSGAEPLGSGVDSDEDEDEESLVPRRDL
ncbi:hypothetical protein B484DRAFT_440571, partial [Ochromonadaceae sp. CCMP2298]